MPIRKNKTPPTCKRLVKKFYDEGIENVIEIDWKKQDGGDKYSFLNVIFTESGAPLKYRFKTERNCSSRPDPGTERAKYPPTIGIQKWRCAYFDNDLNSVGAAPSDPSDLFAMSEQIWEYINAELEDAIDRKDICQTRDKKKKPDSIICDNINIHSPIQTHFSSKSPHKEKKLPNPILRLTFPWDRESNKAKCSFFYHYDNIFEPIKEDILKETFFNFVKQGQILSGVAAVGRIAITSVGISAGHKIQSLIIGPVEKTGHTPEQIMEDDSDSDSEEEFVDN